MRLAWADPQMRRKAVHPAMDGLVGPKPNQEAIAVHHRRLTSSGGSILIGAEAHLIFLLTSQLIDCLANGRDVAWRCPAATANNISAGFSQFLHPAGHFLRGLFKDGLAVL
jgi:hypothetical protein